MDEEKDETQGEPTTENTGEGSESETDKQTAKLSSENERLEKQIEKRKELMAKNKELMAEEKLGGRADAGQKPVKPKESTPEEYAKEVLGGSLNKG